MFELIVYDKNKSYILYGESNNLKDYPTIPVGATVFILDTYEVYSKIGPDDSIKVDFDDIDPDDPSTEPEESTTSVLGEAIIGEMNIGE